MTAHGSRCGMGRAGVAALMVLVLVGCGGGGFDRGAWMERGEGTVRPFKERLVGALTEGLRDGPEAAIEVCQLEAPQIAEEAGSPTVMLGRTSHKLRNQRNAPREWVQPLLDGYAATPGKTEPEVVQLENGGVGYVEPIYVKGMCLACHGSAVSPGVAGRLAEHYPQDQATGFAEGDFRGLFWVEFRDEPGAAN